MKWLQTLALCVVATTAAWSPAVETNLKSDERIVFYPSIAERVPGTTNLWRTQIRGCVFEPEQRGLWIAAFREAVELKTEDFTVAESATFAERAQLFLVDHQRGKKVFVRLGTNEFFVGKSQADGRFSAAITFPESSNATFAAILRSGDSRLFGGAVIPLEPEGVSVISDIDDTIKVTDVRDRRATLRNTFLREFQPVPGMAEFYQSLAGNPLTLSRPMRSNAPSPRPSPPLGVWVANGRERGGSNPAIAPRADPEIGAPDANVTFHYISASPWQLYEPLAAFVRTNGFPSGVFELKSFRFKDRSFFSLFSDPEKYKASVIEPLLKQFPKRQFILIGDSGERDPEIYGALARKFPGQIRRIYIRDVTGEAAESARYRDAFRDLPRERWQVFREPGEVKLPQAAAPAGN